MIDKWSRHHRNWLCTGQLLADDATTLTTATPSITVRKCDTRQNVLRAAYLIVMLG
jgi:hypothetical protein